MDDLAAYEGLVGKTAWLFAAMVGLEQEDMKQELWLKVVKAKRAFDPTRSSMTERRYIYSCVANFVKDLKKLAARRAGMHVSYIEDQPLFERERHMPEEEAFAMLSRFTMPSTVTEQEQHVAALVIVGYHHREVASILAVSESQVALSMKSLRVKLADWSPDRGASPAPSALPMAVLQDAEGQSGARRRQPSSAGSAGRAPTLSCA